MSLTEEESNFFRFYFLNLKIATKAAKVYFDYVHHPAGLASELTNSSVTLKGLRFMTKLQLNILYPSPGQTGTSAEFDTTLIVCLLRNLTPRESAPVTGWDNLPLPGDTSTGADLARVKWYRNQLVHSKDGILSSTDFNQWWGDLEGAIGRLSAKGGLPMLKEAQLAKHVVLDGSLTDMLLELRSCKKSQQELTEKINNQQSSIDILMSNKEEHEKKMHQVNVSHQKGEAKKQKLSTEPIVYKDECTEKLQACKNDIKKNEVTIKELQDQSDKKQNKIADLILHICKLEIKYEQHDKMLKEHDEHLAMLDGQGSKQGEQIAQQAEQLAQHCEQMAQQGEQMEIQRKHIAQQGGNNQTRLEEDTRALIEEDVREATFVSTKAVTDGLLLLKQNGVLLITGYAGTGKSRIGRHVLHMVCTENKSVKCMQLTLAEWDDMTKKNEKKDNKEENMDIRADKVVLLLDDIFGETNCIYNGEKDTPILDKIYAYVCKGNIKVIITIRDTVKRQCQEMFESHRLFKFDFIDLSSGKYVLSRGEKLTFLTKYMKIVRQSDYIKSKGFVDRNGHLILKSNEVSNISRGNPVKGFPLVVYQFVHNDKYFKLGSNFFDRPTEAMLEEMNAIRRKGEDQSNDKRRCMIQYAVMVYTAINENRINPDDNSCGTEISKVINAIYGGTTEMKKRHILDAVKDLKGSYLVNIPNQRSYKLHHPTLQESVILSFAQIDEKNIDKIIPLISWSFFLKMVKPKSYTEKEGEVVLRVPINSYKLLADRLVDFYMPKSSHYGIDQFIPSLCNTEIFQEENCLLLPCLLEALQKEDGNVEHTENMIRSNEMDTFNSYLSQNVSHIKKKISFLANLLETLAMLDGQFDLYNFTLKTFKTIGKTNSHQFTIDYMKSSLISSLCKVCSTKYVIHVKATLEIAEEYKIPVLLDQGVKLTDSMTALNWRDNKPYVCLAFCIWNAYTVFNLPVLEFLLSKYIQTPFDINLFFKMTYSKEMYGTMVLSLRKLNFGNPSLSSLPLKWMIEKFPDQKLDDPTFILRTACKYQMFDTVEYVASICKTFDEISCLQAFVDMPMSPLSKVSFNRELFSFLLKKVDISSKGLIPVVMSIIQKNNIPDYIFDAFLPVCLNSTDILTLACQNGQFYLVNLIMESSRFENLDIQSALMAACGCQSNYNLFFYIEINIRNIEIKKLNIVQYIVEKIGFDQFDLKAVCQQACASKQIKIIEWFVQNIETTRLNVHTFIDAALINKRSDMLEHIMKNIDLESLDKRRVLKSVTEQYTAECSTTILEIVRTIWDSTEDKEVLHMEEIVNTAYERKHFELLMWIHDKCHPHVSIDSKKVIILAVEDARVDVVKWASQTFKQTSLDNNEGKIFIKLCCKMFDFKYSVRGVKMRPELIDTVHWILTNFQIKQSDIVSGVLKLTHVNRKIGNDLISNLVILILEKYLSCLGIEDIKDLIYKSIQNKCYVPVNWFLEKRGSLSYDKQMILNNACADQEIETIKILSKYFYTLDMNQAMIKACTSTSSRYEEFIFQQKDLNNNQSVACLNLLWKEINKIDHDNIDIRTIVSTVCEGKKVSNNVMTWILLNFPLDKIPINEVLTTCCQQSKIQHVKYIFQEVDNEKLDIKEAFVRACLAAPGEEKFLSKYDELNARMNAFELFPMSNYGQDFLMIIDYVFQKLHDKDYCVSLVVNEIVEKKKFNLLLYFRQAGYCRHVDVQNLLNEACGHGHVKLVIWILGNVEHKELDITSAFHAACDGKENDHEHHLVFLDNEERVNHVMCVALLWHYIHDINMFEIDTVLKHMTESQSDTSLLDYKQISIDELKTWLLYIKKINQRKCQSDNALLSSEENINLKRQQVNDGQCCEQAPQENNELNSSSDNDDCSSPTKRLCLEKEEQT